MGGVSFLTDEHIPGPFVGILRSTGYDVLRAKDEFDEGTGDRALIDFSRETDRIVVTCDKQFTTVDGERGSITAG